MTKKISLRKALQVKKNLAGELAKISSKIKMYNSQRYVNKHVNVLELFSEFGLKTAKLIELKSEIAKANVHIYPNIILVDELKSQIAFYETLNTEETGSEYKGGEEVQYAMTVAMNYGLKEENIRLLKMKLEENLEVIDEYNSSHFIEIEE